MERDRAGRTALMYAIIDGEHARASSLLEQGANPDDTDNAGWCALHFAAQDCSTKSVKMLLNAGANLDLRDRHGNTPLWRATMSYKGKAEVISLLLEAGSDPDAANKSGISPRSLASSIANYETAKFFEKY